LAAVPLARAVLARELDTPHGPARVHLHDASHPRAALVLGHGAGGGVGAPDLVAATGAALGSGFSVALVEQPYRVAGRRSPSPAGQLDAAWLAVLAQLRDGPFRGLELAVGGRSSGARVACRTATEGGAVAVLCLAFPLHPPGRADDPTKSRLPELDAVAVPTLVVQGERDPFGRPPPKRGRRKVILVAGDHSLRSSVAVAEAVAGWLGGLKP
jgi:predicted alpha/beta-hydrolase family hydrolase